MSGFPGKLARLRGLYIAYFAALIVIDMAASWKMAGGWLGGWPGKGQDYWSLSFEAFLAIFFLVTASLFALGFWLIHLTARKQNWARVVLLIVGWLTIIDALSSLLFTSQGAGFGSWLERLAPGVDWAKALLVDQVKDVLGLFFWGYLVYLLQFDAEVKREFPASGPDASGPGPGTPPSSR